MQRSEKVAYAAVRGLVSTAKRSGGTPRISAARKADAAWLRAHQRAPITHHPALPQRDDPAALVHGGAPPSPEELDVASARLASRDGWEAVRLKNVPLSPPHGVSEEELAGILGRGRAMRYFPTLPSRDCVLSMPPVADWTIRAEEEGGAAVMRAGERFVQRVLPLPFPLLRWYTVLCMDEITATYDAPGAWGFTAATTTEHDEIGEHTAVLRWGRCDGGDGGDAGAGGDGGDDPPPRADDVAALVAGGGGGGARYWVELDTVSVSTFAPPYAFVGLGMRFMRYLQRRAHAGSVGHLAGRAVEQLKRAGGDTMTCNA